MLYLHLQYNTSTALTIQTGLIFLTWLHKLLVTANSVCVYMCVCVCVCVCMQMCTHNKVTPNILICLIIIHMVHNYLCGLYNHLCGFYITKAMFATLFWWWFCMLNHNVLHTLSTFDRFSWYLKNKRSQMSCSTNS